MEKIKKIGKIIVNILTMMVIIAIILVIYNYVQIKCFNKKYPNFFGYTFLEVSTNSMADTLNIYDIIVVKITKNVQENDIITFEQDDELITHRIVQMTNEEITTKGDANNSKDKSITWDNIVGKVIFTFSGLGIWIKVFSEPKVFISIIITLLMVIKIFSKDK